MRCIIKAPSSFDILLLQCAFLILVRHAASDSPTRAFLPSINGTIEVGVKYLAMTDHHRLDPFSNGTDFRRIMVSLFYPINHDPLSVEMQKPLASDTVAELPYMPAKTAALYGQLLGPYGFTESRFQSLATRCHLDAIMPDDTSSFPLVVFSPGGGTSRLLYTSIMEDLARQGFFVAAVDHTHDALVVEFPDGRTVTGLNKTLTRREVELLVHTRARDIMFAIDELGKTSVFKSGSIDVANVIAFGHSLGGAAIAEAMLNDTRIKGGVNLDGRLFGTIERDESTLSKPFLQFASEETTDDPYVHWNETWERLKDWKLELFLEGAAHSTFSDFPLIAETLHIRGKLGRGGDQLLGKVKALRGLEIIVQYVSAFARFVLTGTDESLLDSHSANLYPEVKFKRQEKHGTSFYADCLDRR